MVPSMTHSVEKHLSTTPDAYDADIQRMVPHYLPMLDEVIGALIDHAPRDARVLDLGAGTGALSERILSRLPSVRLTLVDVDPAMLAQAKIRLAGMPIEVSRASFTDPLPECDAAVASLALHHVKTIEAKTEMYRNIHRSLVPGGALINGDAIVPTSKALSDALYRRWAGFLMSFGSTEAEAYRTFEEWAKEDRYFSLEEELDMLRSAGFREVDLRWRMGPVSVTVAKK